MPDQKRPSVFANRDFKLLFLGSSISALGDQFTLVALPWLVLKLTGDVRRRSVWCSRPWPCRGPSSCS